MFVFLYDKTDKVDFSIVLLCKKQEPSFVVGHFSCIVNVFDYNNSSQASANYCFVSRTEVLKLF